MEPEKGKLSSETARAILKLGFGPDDQARMEILSRKAREGTLRVDESTRA